MSWLLCLIFYARCQCWIICCCVKSATLTFTSPPPLCQVYTGLHHHVCWCWSMNVRMRLSAASSPPPSALLASNFLFSCAEDPLVAVTVGAFSSASSLHQPRQHHSTFESIHFSQAAQHSSPLRILPSSLHESYETAAAASHSGLIYLPPPPLLLRWVCRCNCPPLPSPLHHRSLKCSRKSRQAVSSSSKSVCWLGSWSSAVPLEDDPVDEDRRDGPGGAAGETEDSHPNHRWVTATHTTPQICFGIVISEDFTGWYLTIFCIFLIIWIKHAISAANRLIWVSCVLHPHNLTCNHIKGRNGRYIIAIIPSEL